MTASLLASLRPVSLQQALRSRQLGHGRKLKFAAIDGAMGSLTLSLAPKSADNDWLDLLTGIGPMGLARNEAERFLNQLSAAPFASATAESITSEAPWYLQLYNQLLSAAARALFGYLLPAASPTPPSPCYVLSWQFAESSGQLLVALPDSTLDQLLDRGPWQPLSRLDLSSLQCSCPLLLGTLALQASQISRLCAGDILLPTTPFFTAHGEGSVLLGGKRLQLAYVEEGTLPAYQITYLSEVTAEDQSMYDQYDDNAPSSIHAALLESETPVTLTLQAGQIAMTLKELGQLQVGNVLIATGEPLGHATLYHRQQPVARGELVEVEGRLGVQISSVLLPGMSTDDAEPEAF
ncbi:FliM/FliN family flagellar motor switch protein [Pokkaliibacter sp. MBI-7]|uniref:FliM/FliN family flagellar motor switch protein n=1 Tax=Pokkaliibacter sp. MBI-7 TaxID=3040600 RepID=UPI00244CBFD4|nr:FliM/FliN family flagellar motor switch protein [Pokkaliibacter sp. MBI-7]MDH2435706.1 FliM/FliN family flagellar motor switch protein [Pokkaliibacter sp. MBI-7]